MLTRRDLFKRVIGAAAGVALAPVISGLSPLTDGWTSGVTTLEIGDVFTITGRFALNPITRRPTKYLQQFIVTNSTSTR